ncbi:hypothetical protein M408DRAFT_332805, partial [Serendipita vermifera MAFF 305830]
RIHSHEIGGIKDGIGGSRGITMMTGSISPCPSASTNVAQRRYRPSSARNEYSNLLLFHHPYPRSPHNSQGRFPFLFSHHAAH